MDLLSTRPPATEPAKVDQGVFLRVIWSGVWISFLCLLIRLYARWRTFKKLWFDDAFVVFAWILALSTAIDWQIVSGYMYQFISITSGQLWPPPARFVKDTENYYKGSVAVLVFFYTSLWAVKFSFLLFFRRLGQNVRGQQIFWWLVFGFTVATYLICIGDIQYSCLAVPLPKLFKNCSTDAAVRFQRATLKLNCAVDVMTDYMIMAIPISMLWRVQMSLRKKIALVGIFSLAVITTVFAIVRVTSISALTKQPDTSWSYMWSSIEQCVAIVVACLASFRSLFTDPKTRLPQPAQRPSDDSGNVFLRGIKRTLPSSVTMELASIFKSTGESRTYTTDDERTQGWTDDIESRTAGSREHIVHHHKV
ncbi:MAG: hypothetical protein Q9170_002518 [Blastenia crenularia]